MGPRLSGYRAISVEDLTEVELKSRQLAVNHLEIYRAEAPGFRERLSSSRRAAGGVRHSRRFAADRMVTRAQWDKSRSGDDEIGVSTSLAPKWGNVSVPYGSLLPSGIEEPSVRAVTWRATPAPTRSCVRSRSVG